MSSEQQNLPSRDPKLCPKCRAELAARFPIADGVPDLIVCTNCSHRFTEKEWAAVDTEGVVPVCKHCGETLTKIGSALTSGKTAPLLQCPKCKGPTLTLGMDSTQVRGFIVHGLAYKVGPGRKLIPVAHPDDVWG